MTTKKLFKTISLSLFAVVIIMVGFFIYRKVSNWELYSWPVTHIFKPWVDFDPAKTPDAPDYSDPAYWAALPDKKDEADFTPAGVSPGNNQQRADVNVFYIHPTSLYGGPRWNSPMDPESKAGENVRYMLANQASAFNGACKVYAPHYRDAVIFSYLPGNNGNGNKALDFAYYDVERAFDYFLQHFNNNQPFIIASHSQGTRHGQRLVKERIDGTPLAKKMIVAYLIGGGVPADYCDEMNNIHACSDATDIHCVVHWATFSEQSRIKKKPFLCINPISWKLDEERVPKRQHKGALPVSGRLNLSYWNQDKLEGVEFKPLEAPMPKHTWAQCRNGVLYVEEQIANEFSKHVGGADKSYHVLDYSLFYMDIRLNTIERIQAYKSRYITPDK